MGSVDVVDETFLALWPGLLLAVVTDRGDARVRWTVQGALVGSMEVWLEPVLDGTVLHYYLRADPMGPDGRPRPARPRRAAAESAAASGPPRRSRSRSRTAWSAGGPPARRR